MSTRKNNIHLFSIAWSPEQLETGDPHIQPLDNLANLRPDWREYWVMRDYLLNTELNNNHYYGFFSPKFTTKTGLKGADVVAFVQQHKKSDVMIFSPQVDMGCFFLNVFEQNETFDPGFLKICSDLLEAIGEPTDLKSLVMDSRHVVFSNFIVAKPVFWRRWLEVCEKIFALTEAAETALALQVTDATSYPGQVPRKVFIIERIASLLLSTSSWKCAPYSPYRCAWSALPTSKFRNEAVASDALKMAYNDTQHIEFLQTFYAMRQRIFKTGTGEPFI